MKRLAFLYCMAVLLSSCNRQPPGDGSPDYDKIGSDLLVQSNALLTDVIVGDLFTPPVASRIYAYSNIALYEALRPAYQAYVSYSGQLNDMPGMPVPDREKAYDFSVSALFAFSAVARKLVYSQHVIEAYEKRATDSLRNTMDESLLRHSIEFGNLIADSILAWAGRDRYYETRSMTRYAPRDFEGAWQPTPPDYTPAIEPYWGSIRQFAMDSVQQFMPPPPLRYNMKDTGGAYYKALMEVYDISLNLDTNRMNTAIFWDCNPNVSHHYGHLTPYTQKMTPGGHWITIACNLVRHDDANLMQGAETVSKVAIGVADAFISSWYVKYTYHTIRPITLINQYLDNDWQAYLQTPPFPEYSSAHSTVSGSAAAILKNIYGEPCHWVDSSEVRYGIPVVKSFDSFLDAADEVSESRVLGGIHFRFAVLAGRDQGLEMGDYIYHKLHTRKQDASHPGP